MIVNGYEIKPGADLRGADLRGSNLCGARLWGADLRYANLTYADLRGADLGSAKLTDIDLSGADLCGATLRGTDLSCTHLTLVKTDAWTILPEGWTVVGGKIRKIEDWPKYDPDEIRVVLEKSGDLRSVFYGDVDLESHILSATLRYPFRNGTPHLEVVFRIGTTEIWKD